MLLKRLFRNVKRRVLVGLIDIEGTHGMEHIRGGYLFKIHY